MTKIHLTGTKFGDMLHNIWVANLIEIDNKFDSDTGFFHESGKDYPWYGGYLGIGTWVNSGRFHRGAFSRSSDHFVSLALRCINNLERNNKYVDFVDKYFYYFRNNHDPKLGPPNATFKAEKYPADAPGHWGFVVNNPQSQGCEINEIPLPEETDGHGSVMIGRWLAWRTLGRPTDEWLTSPREDIYGKSRWDTTSDAAEFVCWLMDYTGMDLVWCEGESTGWGALNNKTFTLVPENWKDETDPEKIRKNYANSNMYELYPNYVCMTALKCSAQIADSIGEKESAKRWRSYADRIQKGIMRSLIVGEHGHMTWKQSRFLFSQACKILLCKRGLRFSTTG